MFVKLKIKINGCEFEIHLHEIVFLLQTLVDQIPAKPVQLLPNDDLLDENRPLEKLASAEELPKALAKILVPFTIGPLQEPAEWLYVAKELPKLKPRECVGVNINGNIVGIRLENMYSADFGPVEEIGHNLYFSTFASPWKKKKYAEAHEVTYSEIEKKYKGNAIKKFATELDVHLLKDLRAELQNAYPDATEEQLDEMESEIRSINNTLEEFIPQFLESKRIIDQNRALFFSGSQEENSSEDSSSDELTLKSLQENFEVIQKKLRKVNMGEFDFLPKGYSAFKPSLEIYDPEKLNFQEVEADIAKGPSYQKFEWTLDASFRYFSDAELAQKSRAILRGGRVKSVPEYLPNLIGCWFIPEVSRDNLILPANLMLLDFMESGIAQYSTLYSRQFNLYELKYILRNPYVGKKGKFFKDMYGSKKSKAKKIGPDVMGGMHPMAADGSYSENPYLKVEYRKKSGKYCSQPLSLVQQKMGSISLHWLFCALQYHYLDIELELVEFDPLNPLSKDFDYNEVFEDSENTANPKLLCGLKIEKTNTVALNKLIRNVSRNISKINRSDSDAKEDDKQKELETLNPLRAKQNFVNSILKPILSSRMSSFDNYTALNIQYKSGKSKLQDNRWYTEDVINSLLRLLLGEDAYILSQTQIEHTSLLNENLKKAIAQAILEGKPAVIPIHLHGNHWAGMVIKKYNGLPLQVIYNDPLGHPLENELRAVAIVSVITQFDPNADITDLQLVQQSNGIDCGPFTVDNMRRLVNADTSGLNCAALRLLLAKPYDGSARNIREHHMQLLSDSSTEEEINALFDSKQESTKLLSQGFTTSPGCDQTLFNMAWKIYPDMRFVTDCLSRFYFIEKSLRTNTSVQAIRFVIGLFDAYAKEYKKQEIPPTEIIKMLEEQVEIIKKGEDFKWVDSRLRGLLLSFVCKQVLANMDNTFPINLNQGWVLELLSIIKNNPKTGHIDLMNGDYAHSGFFDNAVNFLKASKSTLEIFSKEIDEFVDWINGQLKGNNEELKLLIKQLLERMEYLKMENTLLYFASKNFFKSLERGSSVAVKIPLDFLVDLKHLDILHMIGTKINLMMLEHKDDELSVVGGSSDEDDGEISSEILSESFESLSPSGKQQRF